MIFAQPLHVGCPNFGDREALFRRIGEAFDRRWLSNSGKLAIEFEERVAKLAGVKHCLAMANGTVAIEIMAQAAGLSGEVIIPSFTFVATAHALARIGLTPVFCDIDPATHNIDPRAIERHITPRTSAILGVHVWGRPCDADALRAIASKHKLALLFDAAHGVGCTYKGRPVGSLGDAETFSFHATKFVNAGEGGALVTNDDALADRARRIRNFGFSKPDEVVELGTNGKMSELAAAMGLTSLDSIDQFIAVNRRNYLAYRKGLANLPGVAPALYDESERCNFQYVPVEIDQAEAGTSRDKIVEALHRQNVLARRYFYPGCHEMEPYRSRPPVGGFQLPATNALTSRVMLLPTGTAVDEAAISKVSELIGSLLSVESSRSL